MLFAKKALEERPTHGVCENEQCCVVTVYRERAFDKQSSSKIMCDKTQRSAINVFQQPLKCDNEEIDCDLAELDQKTKRLLHVIF